MRRFAWTLVALVSLPAIALADCESDVRDAVTKLQTSGPFHFVTQEWNRNFLRQTAGRIIPGKAQHTESTMHNGWIGGETIYIGKQSWKNDGLGWIGPWSTSWTHDRVTPTADLKTIEGTCSEIDGPEWQRIKEYSFSVTAGSVIDPAQSAIRIFVDIDSGLMVRYEKLRSSKIGINMISTYRHDGAIRIEPPVVDMDRRKANALAAFNKAVELTDRDCRNTVIKVLQAGREGMPFKYKIEGDLWAGVWGMHGTFVPPHSVHNAVEGVERHGGGSEYVVIGNDAWAKAPFHDWQKADTPSPLSGEAGAPFFDDFLIGAVSHIGRAQCPSRGQVAGDQIDYHEYDLYRDTTGGRVRAATQRMYTDPDGERPVKLETIGPQGRVVQVQTRTYVPGLVIEPPTAAAK